VPDANSEVYPWVLALGATGIVVGLATYGACVGVPERCRPRAPLHVRKAATACRWHQVGMR
jgi:hypothetical protein